MVLVATALAVHSCGNRWPSSADLPSFSASETVIMKITIGAYLLMMTSFHACSLVMIIRPSRFRR